MEVEGAMVAYVLWLPTPSGACGAVTGGAAIAVVIAEASVGEQLEGKEMAR
jgi:hypothetical protein